MTYNMFGGTLNLAQSISFMGLFTCMRPFRFGVALSLPYGALSPREVGELGGVCAGSAHIL